MSIISFQSHLYNFGVKLPNIFKLNEMKRVRLDVLSHHFTNEITMILLVILHTTRNFSSIGIILSGIIVVQLIFFVISSVHPFSGSFYKVLGRLDFTLFQKSSWHLIFSFFKYIRAHGNHITKLKIDNFKSSLNYEI